MGDAVKKLEDINEIVQNSSPLIQRMLEAINSIGNIKSITPSNVVMSTSLGMSMPITDVSNGVVYVTLNDTTLGQILPLAINYETQSVNGDKILEQLAMFKRNNFNPKNIGLEIKSNPPIADLIEILNQYPIIKELEIGKELVDTKKFYAKRSGFFGLDYHQFKKELTGFMIDRNHPYRGISFQGRVQNFHFGEMVLRNLENYKMFDNR